MLLCFSTGVAASASSFPSLVLFQTPASSNDFDLSFGFVFLLQIYICYDNIFLLWLILNVFN